MESVIKLFKALPIKTKEQKIDNELMQKTIKLGFVFAPEVVANYSNYDELISMVKKTVGLSSEQMNSSFHKSWKKVKEADIVQLVVEQIAHYFTTYGFEALGIDSNYVYIPDEALDLPKIKLDKLRLVVIKGYTKEELKDKLITLLESGIALAEDTVKAALEVAMFIGFDDKDVEKVKNREVKVALYDYLGLIPANPTEFLRFVIFKATSTMLLIKSPDLIMTIKESNNLNIVKCFNDYEAKYGLGKLAEVFYRFKPIFLAFRTNERMKVITNKIRRLAVKNHKPLPEDYLNTVTSKIANSKLEVRKLKSELEKVNIFRKIRLAYALKFRTKDVESILYRIRNGKGYATAFTFDKQDEAEKVLDIVLDSVANDISKNVKGKKIFVPTDINYTLPATEKQFTGSFPSGTCVSLPDDMIVGIHWNNVNHHRIDLDLSLTSLDGKIGWDASYRTGNRDVLFSGDITDARNGASELFYVKKQPQLAYIMMVNYFNFDAKVTVPFKILVAKEAVKDFRKNYTVNPNNVVVITDTKIDQKQKVLGLVITSPTGNKFYFAEINVGKSITSRNNEYTTHSRQYLIDFYENSIGLNDVLVKAGAEIVSEKDDDIDIDLSPELLEKDTILNLLIG